MCVVNTRHLDMTDFDSALYLLNSSQSDALGTPKVSHRLFHCLTVLLTTEFILSYLLFVLFRSQCGRLI